ncbi:sirohydrochlorin chelatase [Sporosalibacterium faouarense]|uniref:sirohydrochlorin chelatase n=1 Tax=Sporosalibacterium faouarense TaxID=516123 RepID=UPI00141CDEF2|nr:CbiX/SirB N-terminal domain-containing protein [Sporosalibacterium faouarense]MTI46554.1 cobalamin biosynthesis protein CbiX [Bacillota bacterium]
MTKALLIVGHGSRSKDAQETFNKMVELVREKSSYTIVEGAHMEICGPSIEEVVENLVKEEVREILMVPYFLYEGIHIKQDIPNLIGKISEKYDGIKIKLGRPIGVEPMLADILISRAEELS